MLPPLTKEEEHFRHSYWRPKRAKVRTTLVTAGANRFAMERFDACGSDCAIEYSEELKKHRVRANYCRSRHCEPCMRAKGNKICSNLKKRLEQHTEGRYRFITLTLKHTHTPLAEQIKRLYRCFRKLRNSKEWKRTQRGGAFMLEVKRSKDGKLWHPHLHIASEGSFLDKRDLSEMWFRATGDSFIADIRSIGTSKDMAFYVSKYVTKGTSNDVWNDESLAQEWILASKGVRMCATFGTWRGYKLLANSDDAKDWKPVCTYAALYQAAYNLEPWAMDLFIKITPADRPDEATRGSKSNTKLK